MGVALPDIAALSRAVVYEHGRGMDVVAVTATEGGTDRVEVMVTIGGCHRDPCQFVVNVTRTDRREFEREFRGKLNDALHKHAAAAS
jgi:hypothetical protein